MLINISNHSYALWKPKQLITALEKFDKVEDFFMPEVNPAFTADQVREMASKIIADIFIQYQHTKTKHANHFFITSTFLQKCKQLKFPVYVFLRKIKLDYLK